MPKSLFVGDSHSSGFFQSDGSHPDCKTARWSLGNIFQWADNNYAEIYAKLNNKETIIYAMPGAGNCKYPDWVASCLQKFDIDEVFVQSTYQNRYRIAANLNLDFDTVVPLDHFQLDPESDDLVTRFVDCEITPFYAEIMRQPGKDDFDSFKGHKFPEDGNFSYLEQLDEKYSKIKVWNELITHLNYRTYIKDLIVIDSVCRQYNVTWHLFNINEGAFIPPYLDLYCNFTNCKRANITASDYIKENLSIDSNDHKIDIEHYDMEFHELIAKHYIPYIKGEV